MTNPTAETYEVRSKIELNSLRLSFKNGAQPDEAVVESAMFEFDEILVRTDTGAIVGRTQKLVTSLDPASLPGWPVLPPPILVAAMAVYDQLTQPPPAPVP